MFTANVGIYITDTLNLNILIAITIGRTVTSKRLALQKEADLTKLFLCKYAFLLPPQTT